MVRGKLIVIEGTDGSGKQTQADMLVHRLKDEGFSSEVLSFPRYGTPTGDIVGDCCLGKDRRSGSDRRTEGSWFPNFSQMDPKVASLYYAADRLDAVPKIERMLSENDYLILDRYVESNMGHQCGKLTDAEERADLRDWINTTEYINNNLPIPDLVVFLYMPLEVSQRLKAGMHEKLDAHEADEDHLRNAERSYIELAGHYNWSKIYCSSDGANPRDRKDIHSEVYEIVSDL